MNELRIPETNQHVKPYRVLQEQFIKVMRKSDELYHEDIRARRVFNRLLREKNRISDLLLQLNESSHLRSDLKVSLDVPEKLEHQDCDNLPALASHYVGLVDNAFDFSSDEEDSPYSNPMNIHEWIHRQDNEGYLDYLDDILAGAVSNRVKKQKDIERRNSDTEDENPRKKRPDTQGGVQ